MQMYKLWFHGQSIANSPKKGKKKALIGFCGDYFNILFSITFSFALQEIIKITCFFGLIQL